MSDEVIKPNVEEYCLKLLDRNKNRNVNILRIIKSNHSWLHRSNSGKITVHGDKLGKLKPRPSRLEIHTLCFAGLLEYKCIYPIPDWDLKITENGIKWLRGEY